MPTTWRDRPWVVATTGQPRIGLVAPIDPQHRTPDANMVPGQINWISDTMVPTLPDELVGDQYLQLPVVGGPLDMEPESHQWGLGVGPGLSTEQNMALTGPWHEEDLGSVSARRWAPQASRDGSYNVNVVPDETNAASPDTVTLRHVTGVGAANSPDARRGYRIQRWRDRWIDRHFWGVRQNPAYLRNAYVSPTQPAGDQGPYVSPFPGGSGGWAGRWGMASPDQFVTPQERRTPRPWDETYTTDGTEGGAAYGLGSWGL